MSNGISTTTPVRVERRTICERAASLFSPAPRGRRKSNDPPTYLMVRFEDGNEALKSFCQVPLSVGCHEIYPEFSRDRGGDGVVEEHDLWSFWLTISPKRGLRKAAILI